MARCGQANSGTSSKPTFNTASDLLLPVKLLKPQNGSLQRALANVLCYIVFQLGCENGSLKNSAQGASQLLYSKLAKIFQLSSWKEMDHVPKSNVLRLPSLSCSTRSAAALASSWLSTRCRLPEITLPRSS